MSYVIAAPEMLATAAADVDGIGSAIRAASASAAGPTTGLLAAAADEVSSAAAALFSEYARECQEVLKQAAAFHGEFTRALAAAGAAYAQAEASNTAAMSGTAGSSGALGSVGMLSGNPLTALMMGGTGEPILSDRVLATGNNVIGPFSGPQPGRPVHARAVVAVYREPVTGPIHRPGCHAAEQRHQRGTTKWA
ncbi:PE family protein [Mycobacterium tuberculosis str. Beijing/NITR203]|nr:PE family protein [Mycobacterium tuberculosis str. Beijing/NITR203]